MQSGLDTDGHTSGTVGKDVHDLDRKLCTYTDKRTLYSPPRDHVNKLDTSHAYLFEAWQLHQNEFRVRCSGSDIAVVDNNRSGNIVHHSQKQKRKRWTCKLPELSVLESITSTGTST